MILGETMQMFEDILHEEDERVIRGFINSSGDLEYSIYKSVDGGSIDLEDREYEKDELVGLLSIELDTFIERNKSTTTIIGHDIRIVTRDRELISLDDLDEEVYEISLSILDGNNAGDIFIESKNDKAYWNIIS